MRIFLFYILFAWQFCLRSPHDWIHNITVWCRSEQENVQLTCYHRYFEEMVWFLLCRLSFPIPLRFARYCSTSPNTNEDFPLLTPPTTRYCRWKLASMFLRLFVVAPLFQNIIFISDFRGVGISPLKISTVSEFFLCHLFFFCNYFSTIFTSIWSNIDKIIRISSCSTMTKVFPLNVYHEGYVLILRIIRMKPYGWPQTDASGPEPSWLAIRIFEFSEFLHDPWWTLHLSCSLRSDASRGCLELASEPRQFSKSAMTQYFSGIFEQYFHHWSKQILWLHRLPLQF